MLDCQSPILQVQDSDCCVHGNQQVNITFELMDMLLYLHMSGFSHCGPWTRLLKATLQQQEP